MAIDPQEPQIQQRFGRENGFRDGRPGHLSHVIGLPRPAAIEEAHDDDDDEPIPDRPLRFQTPHNADFEARRAQFDASVSLARASARQADAQEGLNEAVEGVIKGLPNREAVSGIITKGFAGALAPVILELKGINGHLATIATPKVDDAILFFIVAFDSDGKVFPGTSVGMWLGRAEIGQIDDIIKFGGRSANKRDLFIKRMLGGASGFDGLPERMDADDLGKVYDLAPIVRDGLAGASKPAPSDATPGTPAPG